MQRKSIVRVAFFALLLACAAAIHAQVSTSVILGTVTDTSGAAMVNVQVTATNVETNFTRTAATDAEGRYEIQFLPIGTIGWRPRRKASKRLRKRA